MTTYVDQLTDTLETDERTRRVLKVSHVASSEELLSLLWNFPGLAVEEQIDAAGVSFLASQGAGRLAMDLHAAGLDPGAVMVYPTGASHAEGAGWSPGERLALDTAEQIHRQAADVAGEPVDKLEQLPAPWPIRVRSLGQPGGNAAALLEELRACRPVAISLPVFRDAIQAARHNWNSSVGVLYGKVLDPPPTAVVDGGHAVCVVGFAPDLNEPTGGHFVIRNSWGRGWGRSLPAAGYAAHAPGYGQVSATYVDRFLWEMCRL